jgi:hypothetical protein
MVNRKNKGPKGRGQTEGRGQKVKKAGIAGGSRGAAGVAGRSRGPAEAEGKNRGATESETKSRDAALTIESKVVRLIDIMFMEEAPPAESLDKMRLWLVDEDHKDEKSEALYRKFIEKFTFNPAPVLAPAMWPELARRLGLDETPVAPTHDPLVGEREELSEARTVTKAAGKSRANRKQKADEEPDADLEPETDRKPKADGESVPERASKRERVPWQVRLMARRKLTTRQIVLRVAAVLVPLAILLGGVLWFDRNERHQLVEIVVPAEGVQTIALPDGSIVKATGPATVSWNEDTYAANRQVKLRGEALFEVAEATGEDGSRIPFSVEADGLAVNVLATIFRLAPAFTGDATTAVSLYKGSVGVAMAPAQAPKQTTAKAPATQVSTDQTILAPGERLMVNTLTGESQTELIPASEMAEYGVMPLLRFEESTLGDLIVALEMNFEREIEMEAGIDPTGGQYSANFEGASLEQVLDMLSRIDVYLLWRDDGDTVRVTLK